MFFRNITEKEIPPRELDPKQFSTEIDFAEAEIEDELHFNSTVRLITKLRKILKTLPWYSFSEKRKLRRAITLIENNNEIALTLKLYSAKDDILQSALDNSYKPSYFDCIPSGVEHPLVMTDVDDLVKKHNITAFKKVV